MPKIDLSVTVAGVKFKNPVLSGASELAQDERGVLRLLEAGVGGITTKSFSSMKAITRRPRPYQFPLTYAPHFEMKESGAFYTLACPHPEDLQKTLTKDMPKMSKACKEAQAPLIASYIGLIADGKIQNEDWAEVGKRFEDAGADMLELNLSCPQAKRPIEENPNMSFDVVHAVSRVVTVPVGVKISPEMGPLEKLARGWAEAGARFIAAHNAPDGLVIDVDEEEPFAAPGIGGYVIGRPFLPQSLARCVQIMKTVNIDVMGIGGIYTGYDALQYILAGCPHVLVCTALYLKGTGVIGKILREIKAWMGKKGYTRIDEFRGKALKKIIPTGELKVHEPAAHAAPPDCPYIPLIDKQACTHCLSCVNVCDAQALSFDKKRKQVLLNPDLCWSCGLCVGVCKEEAIVLVDKKDKSQVIWNRHGIAKPFRKIQEKYLRGS